jgi:hypothetical protein
MYSRITLGQEPEGDDWEKLTSKLPRRGGEGAGDELLLASPHRSQWNLMQVQLEGYKDLRQYRAGSNFSRWLADFDDSLPGGALDLKDKFDLLRTKLANPQQVMLKSALTRLAKSEQQPTWQAIRQALIRLVGGSQDAARLTSRMSRTIQEEHESFREWTTRAIDELSNALGRQPEDHEIIDTVTEGANERCIRHINEKGFEDLPSLLEMMDRWDQREGSRNLQRKRPDPTFTPREEEDRERMRVIDLCAWCSQQGHTEEGCRNPEYCGLCPKIHLPETTVTPIKIGRPQQQQRYWRPRPKQR